MRPPFMLISKRIQKSVYSDVTFFFYDSYNYYDVVGVEKTLLGWEKHDRNIYWSKWSMYDKNIGIETSSSLYYHQHDEGVQLFPIITYDENVKSIEVNYSEQIQTKEVKEGVLALFTFDTIDAESNTIDGVAYDATGHIIYRLEKQDNLWIWVPIE